MKAAELRDVKRIEAEERNAKWQALSFEQQIASLDKTFGKDKGAAKQRTKIARQIATRDAAAVVKKSKKAK